MIAAMMSKMQIVEMPRNAPAAVSARSSFGRRCAISKIISSPRLISLFPISRQASV